jgi:hypothetical protein
MDQKHNFPTSLSEQKLLLRLRQMARGCYFAFIELGPGDGLSFVPFNVQPRKREVMRQNEG